MIFDYEIKNKLEEAYLSEMAMSRRDAINRCCDLGKQFIDHFYKIMHEGKESEYFHHHCSEMQNWFDVVKNIVLTYNNKKISIDNLINWFFTIGSDIETIIEEPYQDIYEFLVINLLRDRDTSKIEDILNNIL